MSVIRVKKRENPFAQIDKNLLNNPSLRWQEKGLLAYLLSLPDDWSIYINELTKHSENARDSTARIINNLIKKGYIIRERKREKGTFRGYNYYVFESPQLAESWFSVNGKSVNGKSVNGKADTTNNNLTNKDLTNNINKECVNTQNTPPIEKEKEIDKPTQEDPLITITDETGKKIILRDDQIKEHMNIVLNKLPEANIQAEFYHQCRLQKIKCILEYKVENCRFDALVYDENRNVKCIVEFKSYKTRKKPKTNTNQINKYKKFGLPIIMCTRFEDVKWAVEEAKKTLKPKKEKFIPPTETDAANYAEERIIEKYPGLQNASQHAESTAEDFVNFYGCKNWMVGRTKMQNWKFALNRWIKKNYEEGKYNPRPNASNYDNANNNEARYGAAKVSDIKQALFELDQEKREGVFF